MSEDVAPTLWTVGQNVLPEDPAAGFIARRERFITQTIAYRPKARNDHPDTAHEAAEQAKPAAPSQRAQILALFAEGIGYTDEEIQTLLNMNPSTERPRRVELVEAGLVHDSGVRRRTRSGRNAIVWEPT